MEEAEQAVAEIREGKRMAELGPQNAYIRRLQHLLVQRHQLTSSSRGEGNQRRVVIFKGADFPTGSASTPDKNGDEVDNPALPDLGGTV